MGDSSHSRCDSPRCRQTSAEYRLENVGHHPRKTKAKTDANRAQAQRGRVQLETKSENDRAVLSLELRNQNQGEALKLMQNLDDKCIICEL